MGRQIVMLGIELGDTQELCVSDWQPSWHQSPLFTTQVRDPTGREPLGEARTVDGPDLGLKQRLGELRRDLRLFLPDPNSQFIITVPPITTKARELFIKQNARFSCLYSKTYVPVLPVFVSVST